MPAEVSYPIKSFAVSDALSSTDLTAILGKTTTDLASGTFPNTGADAGKIIVGTTKVTAHELRSDLRSYSPKRDFAEVDVTSLADEVKRRQQGRPSFDLECAFNMNYDANRSYDVLIKDSTGTRLIYIEQITGKKLVGAFVIGSNNESFDKEGDAMAEVTFWNVGALPGRA